MGCNGRAHSQVAFSIFKTIHDPQTENQVISPFSISTALAMAYAGARGETATQMSETLFFDPDQDAFHEGFHHWMESVRNKGAVEDRLRVANSMWPQEDFHFVKEYLDLVEKHYNSALYPVDYEGDREAIRQQINQWVLDNTNNLIEELIKPGVLTDDTRLVLVNAIYFLSQWKIAFDENATRKDAFFTKKGSAGQVPFMNMKDTIGWFQGENFRMIELEYAGGDFSMVIALPDESYEISSLLETINAALFADMAENKSMEEVQVYLPSFRVRSSFDMEETLASMGMPQAFSNSANFSGMTQLDDLKIDKVIHQAYIDVNEEGTEAAASTAVVIIRKSAVVGEEPLVFRANRPFLYFIKENTNNAILFMGKVSDPSLLDE
ncbi:MAG: serpin family protein [Bacteroidota bacterium]